MATQTIWGAAQNKIKFATGINFYTTASHGGFVLSKGKNAQMPEYLRNDNCSYEEDCEFAKVILAFPQYFKEKEIDSAKECLKAWNPYCYERMFNVVLQPGESYIKDKDLEKLNKQ